MGRQRALPERVTAAMLRINGHEHPVVFPTHHTLLEVLREGCGLTGTKHRMIVVWQPRIAIIPS